MSSYIRSVCTSQQCHFPNFRTIHITQKAVKTGSHPQRFWHRGWGQGLSVGLSLSSPVMVPQALLCMVSSVVTAVAISPFQCSLILLFLCLHPQFSPSKNSATFSVVFFYLVLSCNGKIMEGSDHVLSFLYLSSLTNSIINPIREFENVCRIQLSVYLCSGFSIHLKAAGHPDFPHKRAGTELTQQDAV